MVEQEEGGNMHIKLIDFGIAGQIENGKKLKLNLGTVENCAPEVIKQE